MAQAQLHKKMLTLNVTNRIIMKITVWLIPTRQRFDNCLLKKFNYMYPNSLQIVVRADIMLLRSALTTLQIFHFCCIHPWK
jgi:hypothetical protein